MMHLSTHQDISFGQQIVHVHHLEKDSWVRIVDARSLPIVEENGTKHKNSSYTLVSLINRTDKLSCSV